MPEVVINRAKIMKRFGDWYVKQEDNRHIYTIYYSTNVKKYVVYNILSKKEKEYMPEEFIYGSIFYNEFVDAYPNYVHKQLWMLYEFMRGRG